MDALFPSTTAQPSCQADRNVTLQAHKCPLSKPYITFASWSETYVFINHLPALSDEKPVYSGLNFSLAYHPFSLMVFLIWTAFIAVLITLLELSATFAPTSIHQPWYYNWLPGVLLTIFMQGHVAVTA